MSNIQALKDYAYTNYNEFKESCQISGAKRFLEEITPDDNPMWQDRIYAVSFAKDELYGCWDTEKNTGVVYSKVMRGFSTSRRKFIEI